MDDHIDTMTTDVVELIKTMTEKEGVKEIEKASFDARVSETACRGLAKMNALIKYQKEAVGELRDIFLF